jgi:hypothetical protein
VTRRPPASRRADEELLDARLLRLERALAALRHQAQDSSTRMKRAPHPELINAINGFQTELDHQLRRRDRRTLAPAVPATMQPSDSERRGGRETSPIGAGEVAD